MNIYENVAIFNVSLSEEALQSAILRVKEQIAEADAELLKTDLWGRRKLAYEINKSTHGYYVLFTFRGVPESARKIEAFYRVFESVVKQMIIKLEKKQAEHVLNSIAATAAAAAVAAAPAPSAAPAETPAEAPSAEATA